MSKEIVKASYEVTSVKRVSDGIVFSVGDAVNNMTSRVTKINICPSGNVKLILETPKFAAKEFINSILLQNAVKVKAPIIAVNKSISSNYNKVSTELDDLKRTIREANKKVGNIAEVLKYL